MWSVQHKQELRWVHKASWEALPTSESAVITTTCELTVVEMVVVHTLEKYGCEISMWLETALPLWSYSYCKNHYVSNMTNKGTILVWAGEGRKLLVAKSKLCDMRITDYVFVLFTTQCEFSSKL